MKYLQSAKKYKYYLLGGALLIVIIIGYIWANNVTAKQEVKEEVNNEELVHVEEKEEAKIKVEIKGQVKKPNVYELDTSSRVIDLINKAGGLTKEANTNNLNLSKILTDQAVVIVYSNDEINSFKEEKQSSYSVVVEKVECPDKVNSACIDNVVTSEPTKVEETNLDTNQKDDVSSDTKNDINTDTKDNINVDKKNDTNSDSTTDTKEEKTNVNINTASKEELMTVKGIGEKKALAIIAYREENGSFKSIEDIKNVSGIGDSIYEKIKDNITV